MDLLEFPDLRTAWRAVLEAETWSAFERIVSGASAELPDPPRGTDLGGAHLALIRELYRLDSSSQLELADRMGVTPPYVSMLLDRLENAGLVQRRVEMPRKHVELTDGGWRLATQLERRQRAYVADRLSGLALHELENLCAALLRIAARHDEVGVRAPLQTRDL